MCCLGWGLGTLAAGREGQEKFRVCVQLPGSQLVRVKLRTDFFAQRPFLSEHEGGGEGCWPKADLEMTVSEGRQIPICLLPVVRDRNTMTEQHESRRQSTAAEGPVTADDGASRRSKRLHGPRILAVLCCPNRHRSLRNGPRVQGQQWQWQRQSRCGGPHAVHWHGLPGVEKSRLRNCAAALRALFPRLLDIVPSLPATRDGKASVMTRHGVTEVRSLGLGSARTWACGLVL